MERETPVPLSGLSGHVYRPDRERKQDAEKEIGKKTTSCSPEIPRDPHQSKLEEEEEEGMGDDGG